jgi:hypothetical protein
MDDEFEADQDAAGEHHGGDHEPGDVVRRGKLPDRTVPTRSPNRSSAATTEPRKTTVPRKGRDSGRLRVIPERRRSTLLQRFRVSTSPPPAGAAEADPVRSPMRGVRGERPARSTTGLRAETSSTLHLATLHMLHS